MNKVFRNETGIGKLKVSAQFFVHRSWMSDGLGEGGKEIGNHGRSGAKSFSQETVANGQRCMPRMGVQRPTLKSYKCRTHADPLTQLPIFYFSSGGRRV